MSSNLPDIIQPENLYTDPVEVVVVIDSVQQMGLVPDVLSDVIDSALAEMPFGEQAHGTAKDLNPA